MVKHDPMPEQWRGPPPYRVCTKCGATELAYNCTLCGGKTSSKGYFSVSIPWSDTPTVWHPTEKEGPFSTLVRGSFKSEQEAHDWAVEHLGHKPKYTVVWHE